MSGAEDPEKLQDALCDLLESAAGNLLRDEEGGPITLELAAFAGARISSFSERGVLNMNHGIVLRFPNGAEFQLAIVQSAHARPDEDEE